MTIDFHPAADAELWAAADWYDEQEPDLGTRFGAAVRAAIVQIAGSPRTWKPWPENPAVRIFSLWRFPFHIPYVFEPPRGHELMGLYEGIQCHKPYQCRRQIDRPSAR